MIYRLLAGFAVILFAHSVFATELEQKTEQLCQRMTQCTWQSLDADHMSVDMEQTITSSLDSLCASIKKEASPLRTQHIQNQAQLCIDSMLALDCDTLVYSEVQTPACSILRTSLTLSPP